MAGRVSSPVLVGRDAELQTIGSALHRATSGETVHVLVAGEAGVGKTRFTTEVEAIARARGFRVLRGTCTSVGGSSLPYGPLVEALRGLRRELDDADLAAVAGRGAADLARLVPGIEPIESTPPVQSEWVQSRLFEALLGLLSRLAERAPILLVIEDLHWADPATRETIAFLVGSMQQVPELLLGTFRSDELHRRHPLLPWLAELERSGRVERLELARLDRTQLHALVTGILGTAPEVNLVDDVFKRSDGNPFFAEELLAARRQQATPRLPPTLREVILARLANVPETAQPVLNVAAVAGRSVAHDLLARVAGLPETELLEGLRASVGEHLLVVETEGGRDRYAFRHALVQEVVYDDLLPGERRKLHRAVAEAVDPHADEVLASEPGSLAELAHHWAAAGESKRAFEASLKAAEAAMSSYAFGAALEEYERALGLWDGLAGVDDVARFDRIELLRRAGRAAYLAANYRRAVAHRREAVARADPANDPVRAGILREELGRALYVLGEPSASLEAYRDAIATIPVEPPTPERARALSGLGQILMLLDRHEESRVLCEEAIAIARSVGARAQEGHALNTLGRDLAALGECDRGVPALEESLRIAREVRTADDVGRAYVNLAEALDDCGRTDRALEVTAEGIQAAEEWGIDRSYGQYIRLGGVACAYALGRWDEASRLLDEATSRTGTGTGPEVYRLANSLALLVGQGRLEAADAGFFRAFELIDEVPGAQFAGPIHAAAAERELWRHDPRAALDQVERGLRRLATTDDRTETARLCRIGAWAAADLAAVARAVRNPSVVGEAGERLNQLRALLEQMRATMTGGGLSRQLAAHRATSEAEAHRLEGTADADGWGAVAEEWRALDRPYLTAYARWREGEAALVVGDRASATNALQDAHSTAFGLGATPLREAVEALARRGRIPIEATEWAPTASEPGTDIARLGLTPRELEVLGLVADGRTNRQIAEALFISESTASVHVSNILGKLGVATRGEAAAIAFRLGWAQSEGHSRFVREDGV